MKTLTYVARKRNLCLTISMISHKEWFSYKDLTSSSQLSQSNFVAGDRDGRTSFTFWDETGLDIIEAVSALGIDQRNNEDNNKPSALKCTIRRHFVIQG